MYAFKLILLIDSRAEHLSEGLIHRMKSADRCSDLVRLVPSDELRKRSNEIYRDLGDWLLNKKETEIEKRYIALGMKRFQQRVPYPDLLWAVTATKEYLWEFMLAEGLFAEPIDLFGEIDLLHSMDRFFDRISYFAAMGYENVRHGESGDGTSRHAVAR